MALVYSVSAGAPVDADVVSRELSVVIDGGEAVVSVFSKDTTDFGEIKVAQDANVLLSLTDIDDAGNRSKSAVANFVAKDTIAPAAPGMLGATLLREEE